MDEETEKLLKDIQTTRILINSNEHMRVEAVEKLQKWSRIGDYLIGKYNILNINDCVYIMDLLQTKIDFLNLQDKYLNLSKKLEI